MFQSLIWHLILPARSSHHNQNIWSSVIFKTTSLGALQISKGNRILMKNEMHIRLLPDEVVDAEERNSLFLSSEGKCIFIDGDFPRAFTSHIGGTPKKPEYGSAGLADAEQKRNIHQMRHA